MVAFQMAGYGRPRRSLIVFRNPPLMKEVNSFDSIAPENEDLALIWKGINYCTGTDEKSRYKSNNFNERKKETQICSSVPESTDSSDGITLHRCIQGKDGLSAKSNSHSSEDYSHLVEFNDIKCQENKQTDDFESLSDLDENDSCDDIASLQTEYEAVIQTSQVTGGSQSHPKRQDEEMDTSMYRSSYFKDMLTDKPSFGAFDPMNSGEGKELKIEPFTTIRPSRFNILALVLQVNAEKSVKLKKGSVAQFASLYIAGMDSNYIKLSLWHDCKNWTRTLVPGNIIIVTDVMQHVWKDQLSLSTTFSSELVNFHHPKDAYQESWPCIISKKSLYDFASCMEKRHPLIFKMYDFIPSLKKAHDIESFDDIVPGAMVNLEALVKNIDYCPIKKFKQQNATQQAPIVVCLQDKNGKKIRMSLSRNHSSLLSMVRKNHSKWLKFKRLMVRTSSTGVDLELHSVSDTNIQLLPQQTTEIFSQGKRKCVGFQETIKGSVKFLELHNGSGSSFMFSQDSLNELVNEKNELLSGLRDAFYTACEHCLFELEFSKHIGFEPCKRCIGTFWNYDFKKVETLRPFKLHVETEDLNVVPITVFPNEFCLLKDKYPFRCILEICKEAKKNPNGLVCRLKDGISRIFEPTKFTFIVSKEDYGSANDTFTNDEVHFLKDFEEIQGTAYKKKA